ncbi:MAG: non-heme iron oxygenase ferredoxin subunit [Gemmatimonadota bacterium]
MAFVRVASLDDIADGDVLEVRARDKPVCLARVGDEVFAFSNNCTHRDFPLSDGELDPDDCSITCEWHGARFDIRSGKALSLPATRPVPVYECRVEEGVISVEVD